MEKVKLFFLDAETIRNRIDEIISSLSEKDVAKAKRLPTESGFLLSLGGAFLVSKITGGKDVFLNEYGKPYSDGTFFSVSHSVDLVGLAAAENAEVGLDIEKIRDTDERLKNKCLSSDELSAAEGKSFLPLFVAKESLAKATGKGLGGNVKKFPAFPAEGKVVFGGETYYRRICAKEGYAISVCLRGFDFTLSEERVF